jgi:hypothetical protein
MIIVAPRLLKFLAWFMGFSKTARGMAIGGLFFIARSKEDLKPWLITHETIHLKQQRDLLVVGSLLLHIAETFIAIVILRLSWYEAYRWLSCEQEAYRNQNDPDYPKNRKPFAQFKYLFNKKKFLHKDGVVTYL